MNSLDVSNNLLPEQEQSLKSESKLSLDINDNCISHKFPKGFLYERELSEGDMKKIHKQWVLFNQLSEIQVGNPLRIRHGLGLPELPEGTLIHGNKFFNKETLESIKKTGILSGNFLGISEDGETYYCADFFRANKDYSILEYCNYIKEPERIGKNITKAKMEKDYTGIGRHGISFLISIEPPELQDLIKMDAYRDKNKDLQNIIHHLPIEDSEMQKRLSAILVGIPSNFISGVILGEKAAEKAENIQIVREIFGENILIFGSKGEVL